MSDGYARTADGQIRYVRTVGGIDYVSLIHPDDQGVVNITTDAVHVLMTQAGWRLEPGDESRPADPPPPQTTFDTAPAPMIIETPAASRIFEVDQTARTIYGLMVPFGVPTAVPSWDGIRFVFQAGAIVYPPDPTRIKLLISHDRGQAVGKLIEHEETDAGAWGRFSVASTAEGDHALQMAADGVWDGLSVGIRDGATYEVDEESQLTTFTRAVLAETSLTPDPAFADARVAAVAAEAPAAEGTTVTNQPIRSVTTTEGTHMPESTPGSAEGVVPTAPVFAAPSALTIDAPSIAALGTAMGEAFASHLPAPAGPQLINPAAGAFETDPAPYAFERGRFGAGDHDFSADLFAAYRGDQDAGTRALTFVQAQFATSVANVAAATPDGYRPDLAVSRSGYNYPLWTAVNKGALTDGTPFKFPVFSAATPLVAAHVTGTPPTDSTFVLVSKTVTPGAMSGRIQIPREVIDAGGNPQVSGWIWGLMVQAYNEALESAVAAGLLAEAANITDVALTAAAVDGALVSEILSRFAELQYVRGGFRFSVLGAQIALYRALAAAKDSAGRQILSYIAPSNASGSARARLGSLDLLGVEAVPCWALAPDSANAENSWLIDPGAVHGWATPPQRFDFQYRVEYVDLAIWGYQAVTVADTGGVRQITYDRGV